MGPSAVFVSIDLDVYRQRSMIRKQQLLLQQSVLKGSSLNRGEKLFLWSRLGISNSLSCLAICKCYVRVADLSLIHTIFFARPCSA